MLSTISRFRSYLAGPGLGPLLIKTVTGSAGLRIVGMGFGFLVGVQLARGLGAEGYGIYGVVTAIISLLTVPTELGMPHLVTREVAAAQIKEDWGRLRGILSWSTRMSSLMTAIVMIAVIVWIFGARDHLSSALVKTLLLGLLMIPIGAFVSVRAATLRGLQKILKGQLSDVLIRPAVYSLLLFVWGVAGVQLFPDSAMLLAVIAAFFSLLATNCMLRKEMPLQVPMAVAVEESRNWFFSTIPMALTHGAKVYQSHVVLLIASLLVDSASLGVFKVSVSTALLVGFPITMMNIVFAPITSRMNSAGKREELARALLWASVFILSIVLILFVVFLLLGTWFFGVVFGPEYSGALCPFLIISIGAMFQGVFGINASTLNMIGFHVVVTRVSIWSLLFIVVLTPPFVFYWGITGAALAELASVFLGNFILWRKAISLASLDLSIFSFLRSYKMRGVGL